MKRILTASLAAALLIAGMAACGSKDTAPKDYESVSRVLYDEDDTETETDEYADFVDEDTESTESKASDTDSAGSASSAKDKDQKLSVSSRAAASSKKSTAASSSSSSSTSSKSSNTVTSRATTNKPVTTTIHTTENKSSDNDTSSQSESSAVSSAASSKPASSDTDSSTDVNSDTNTDTTASTDSETTSSAAEPDTDSVVDSDQEITADQFDENTDLSFTYGSYTIVLNEDMQNVIANLGEDYSYSTEPDSEIKVYDYGEFSVSAISSEDDETDRVAKITLKAENVSTGKGIAIGSPLSDVFKIYGDNYQHPDSGVYRYYSSDGSSCLQFSSDNSSITNIIITVTRYL